MQGQHGHDGVRNLGGFQFGGVVRPGPHARVGGKMRLHFAGVHEHYPDVVFAQFLPPAFGHALERKLGGYVSRAARKTGQPRRGRNVDDVAVF